MQSYNRTSNKSSNDDTSTNTTNYENNEPS